VVGLFLFAEDEYIHLPPFVFFKLSGAQMDVRLKQK
jgi:hypothetical protein